MADKHTHTHTHCAYNTLTHSLIHSLRHTCNGGQSWVINFVNFPFTDRSNELSNTFIRSTRLFGFGQIKPVIEIITSASWQLEYTVQSGISMLMMVPIMSGGNAYWWNRQREREWVSERGGYACLRLAFNQLKLRPTNSVHLNILFNWMIIRHWNTTIHTPQF